MSSTGVSYLPLRLLFLINDPKLADKVNDVLRDPELPMLYHMRGKRLDSSEMMDLLGFGSITRIVSMGLVTKQYADTVLERLENELKLGKHNDGMAFTTALSSISSTAMKIVDSSQKKELLKEMETDIKEVKKSCGFSLIISIINQGFSEDLMDAARDVGVPIGTVLHARQLGGEAALNFLGIPIQEERELVFIVTKSEEKARIMQAISEKCGVHSKARGITMSTPIDSCVGFEG